MKSIIFVCLGNICRSPIAEGCANKLINKHSLNKITHQFNFSHNELTKCSKSSEKIFYIKGSVASNILKINEF